MHRSRAAPRASVLAVRGYHGFRWSSTRLEALVRAWARVHDLDGRVVVVWDHGACSCAFAADGVGLAFAGPSATADDLIAAQTGVLLRAGARRVWVATSDRELVQRATAADGALAALPAPAARGSALSLIHI